MYCKCHINCVWKQCLKIPPRANQTLLCKQHLRISTVLRPYNTRNVRSLILSKCLFFLIIPNGLTVSESAEFAHYMKTVPVHQSKTTANRQGYVLLWSNPLWSLFSQSGIMPRLGTPAPPNKRKKLSKIITDLSHITQDGETPTIWALYLIVGI